VLMVVDLPEQVTYAAVAPKNDWFIVSGEDTIYRVNGITGEYEVLLTNTSGAVALNDKGNQLAVLGSLQVDPDSGRLTRINEQSNLGVYDLTRKKWLAKTSTPIVVDRLVYFDGNNVVGYGRGGRVRNRRASSFRCDVRLNVATGKSKLTHGLELFRSARDDDKYTPPKKLAGVLEGREAATKRLAEVRDQFNPSAAQPAASRIFHPLPKTDYASMLVDRRLSNGFASGLLNIRRDGSIDIAPVKIDGIQYIRLLDDRLVEAYDADRGGKVFDFLTKEPVLQLPQLDNSSRKKRFHKFFPTGCLLHEDGTLSWYRTKDRDAAWKTKLEQPLRNLYPVFVSPDSRYLAINNNQGGNLFDIYSLTTGKPVCSIPRTKDIPTGYSHSPSFSHDGTRLGATIGKRFYLYDIPSGKQLRDEPAPHDQYHWHVTPVGQFWVIASDTSSSIFHERTGWGRKIPLDGIYRAAEIRCRDRDSLLVETRRGLGAIVDLDTGKLQAKWYVGDYQGSMGGPEFPPRAFTAFDGKLLIRRVAHAAEIELIDLETLTPIAKVHPVPVDDKLGWIISTSDGYWDASPGAEKYLAMYDGLRRLTSVSIAERRNSAEIRKRIARMSSR
jgi:hypothetical protein